MLKPHPLQVSSTKKPQLHRRPLRRYHKYLFYLPLEPRLLLPSKHNFIIHLITRKLNHFALPLEVLLRLIALHFKPHRLHKVRSPPNIAPRFLLPNHPKPKSRPQQPTFFAKPKLIAMPLDNHHPNYHLKNGRHWKKR